VSIPDPLTARAISGLTFSVVAPESSGQSASYALGLTTPRFDSFADQCGLALFGAGDARSY
jgi:hypothetical protein